MIKGGAVPDSRISPCNQSPVNPNGDYVIYWMTAFRRVSWNFALDRAVDWAKKLDKPLLVLEPLRCDYPWASDRFHAFVLEGMAANEERLKDSPVGYFPYVERQKGEGRGLLEALAERACVVLTDDFPGFFVPAMTKAAAEKVSVFMEKVDSNGVVPLSLPQKEFQAAYHFRRFSQKHLIPLLNQQPKADPFHGLNLPVLEKFPPEIDTKWPAAPLGSSSEIRAFIQSLPIDHGVKPVNRTGGTRVARELLKEFLKEKLPLYAESRNHPDEEAESGLSPYLHFGHISSHEIVLAILEQAGWQPEIPHPKATGKREGWWKMDSNAEAFLDQVITWRELGFVFSRYRNDYDKYESLPDWAARTLKAHANDPRPYIYSLEEFDQARTHEPIWNAAQNQLRREGVIHNYLRMLWGKKILHWTPTPKKALEIMLELNNRYALDGRDPNSYSGIFWILGRHDRAWGPERPVFGKVRYMTSASTKRKLRLKRYLEKWDG